MRLIGRLGEIARAYPDRTAVLVLALLPFLLFMPALLPGRVLTPVDQLFLVAPWSAIAPATPRANPALADVSQVFHPWALYTAREVREGRLPLWNPYAYAGVPFVSNPQTALFFPLTWLAWLLPPTLALTLPQVLKVAAAGPAMYWFLRTLAVSPLPAFIGGAGFMLSTTLIAWLPWTYSTTMVFLPVLFGLVERLAQRVDGRRVALLALALAGDMLAGYPPSAFHGVLATILWAIIRAPWRGAHSLRYFVALGVAGGLGAGVTAVQMLPAVDYMRESAVYFYRSQWTPPLAAGGRSALTALMPYFFGVGSQTWSGWQFGIMSTYVGVVLLLGLPLALLAWRRSPTLPLLAMAVGAAAVHYGMPGVDALADAPGMALVNKLRLMPLVVFPVCALGALGLDAACRPHAEASTRQTLAVRVWFVGLVVIALAAVGRVIDEPGVTELRPSLVTQYVAFLLALTLGAVLLLRWLVDRHVHWAVALAAVQVASLAPVAGTYLPVRDARWLYPTPPAITWLQKHAAGARAVMADQVGFLYGIRQASGYDGLTPRRIEQVAGPIGSGNAWLNGFAENVAALHGSEPLAPLSVLFSPVRDLLGIRWIVLGRHAEPPASGLRLAYDGADARIFENPRALPRAFVARRARCVDDRTALALLRARAIDPAAEVLLADCATPTAGGAVAERTEARITVDEAERVAVTAATDAPAWLVLTDTWFPGWTARVDGAEVPIARANHAFRAVALAPGRHDVEFVFRPRGLGTGAAITVLSLGALGVLLIRRPRAVSLVAVAAVVLSASAASATLPPSPFGLTAAPPKFLSGDTATVSVHSRGGAEGRWDLYVVWLYTERAAFLGADGAWHPRPVPFRVGAVAGETVTAAWKNAGPAGEATLALLTVVAGGNPLERLDWRFRPSLATVQIGAPSASRPLSLGTLGALLATSAVAVALVLRVARATGPTPPTAAERTRSTSRRPLPADSRP